MNTKRESCKIDRYLTTNERQESRINLVGKQILNYQFKRHEKTVEILAERNHLRLQQIHGKNKGKAVRRQISTIVSQ